MENVTYLENQMFTLKSLVDLKIGDSLQRKNNNTLYQLQDISVDSNEIFTFFFFGFAIRGSKNLRNHFETENKLFKVF